MNPSARKPVELRDPVLEALIELARSAARNDADRRAKLRLVEPRQRRNAA